MKRFVTAFVSALALVLVTGATGRADTITADTVGWTFNFSVSAPNNMLMGSNGGDIFFNHNDSGQGLGSGTANGTSNVVATNLKINSTTSGNTPETLVNQNFTLSLQLSTLEPNVTQNTATLNFAVALHGTFSQNNSNIMLDSFTPLPGPGVTTGPGGSASVTLGSFVFTVSTPSFTWPGPSSQLDEGSASVLVTVTDANGGGAAQQVPEPSTMLLSCLGGLSLAGMACRRKRKVRV
jgi:hypothetical protein